MIRNMRSGMPSLFKKGSKSFRGKIETTERSLEAIISLAEVFQTSFGPKGLTKIVINHLDRISITSDSASILSNIDVNHPVAKMVVNAAKMQEKEIGDGSNLVIIFAGELCRIALEYLHEGIEIGDIVNGLDKTYKRIPSLLNEMSFESDEKVINNLTTFIKTSISSKLPEHDSFFASLIASACKAASSQSPRLESADKQTRSFSVDDIRVQKIAGGGLEDSFVVNGLTVFNRLLAGAKTVEDGEVNLEDVKIAAFNGSVDTMNTETKGVVVMENAEQLLNFSKGEEEKMEGEVKRLSELGVKVILSGGKFGDMALHFMKQTGIWGLEITSKFDLRRAVKLTGCRAIPSWGDKVSKDDLGHCKRVSRKEIGSTRLTLLEQSHLDCKLATVLIRGSSENVRSKAETAVDDGVNAVKSALKDNRLLLGGGASEIALSASIRKNCLQSGPNATFNAGVETLARALEVIPRRLAMSCGMDGPKTVSRLVAKQNSSGGNWGIALDKAELADMKESKVFDLCIVKENALRLATEAIITALLVDNIIMAKTAGGPKLRKNTNWDDD